MRIFKKKIEKTLREKLKDYQPLKIGESYKVNRSLSQKIRYISLSENIGYTLSNKVIIPGDELTAKPFPFDILILNGGADKYEFTGGGYMIINAP